MKTLLGLGLVGLLAMTGCGGDHAVTAGDSDVNALENLELSITRVETPAEVLEQIKNLSLDSKSTTLDNSGAFKAIDMILIGQIMNLGKEVWQIVDQNKPVSNIKYDYATAVPKGVTDIMSELQGFSDLKSSSYRISLKTRFGTESVGATYTTVHQYNGNYQGKGKYLATVGVIPSQFNVGWGVKADFAVSKISTVNVGTDVDPIASMTMELKLSTRSSLKSRDNTIIFGFRGDRATPQMINNGGL